MTQKKSALIVAGLLSALVGCTKIESEQEGNQVRIGGGRKGTVIERTEEALLDQISCRQPPEAGFAITAMIKNGLLRETAGGGDGSPVFVPTKAMQFLGFSISGVTGWQPGPNGEPVRPFFRGPGVAPRNFIAVSVHGDIEDVKGAVLKAGLQEAKWVDDPNRSPFELAGEVRQPQKQIPGVEFDGGGLSAKEEQLPHITTLTCMANDSAFEDQE